MRPEEDVMDPLLPPTDPGLLSVSAERRVDDACLRFEAALREGGRPRIAEYLGNAAGSERAALLRELLLLDLEYRRKQGETPSVEEYGAQFPGDADVVASAWGLSPPP